MPYNAHRSFKMRIRSVLIVKKALAELIKRFVKVGCNICCACLFPQNVIIYLHAFKCRCDDVTCMASLESSALQNTVIPLHSVHIYSVSPYVKVTLAVGTKFLKWTFLKFNRYYSQNRVLNL